jgi:ribosomal protein S21
MRLKRLKRSVRQRALVDRAVTAYTQWRAESAGVWNAYRRWVRASAAERPFAFDDYVAALDREEHAARRYARMMDRAGHLREMGLAHQLVQIDMSSRGR